MTAYGPNFEFRVSPKPNNRSGRYKNGTPVIPIGVPVVVAAASPQDAYGRTAFALATGAQVRPKPGQGGIACYEYAFEAFEGRDPYLTTTSDLDTVPSAAPCQLVNGDDVVVVLRNTIARTKLGRPYPGRIMVAGLSIATPTLAPGDLLTPGTGTDGAGYWAETSVEANAWLYIVKINSSRGEVEARMAF